MDINQKQKERLEQQFAFIREIDKEKFIGRQTYLTDGERKENDAEHAWHMAIMAYLFREHSNESVDIAKVMLMCLIHDIVEIDAGDTYAYDTEGLKTQKQELISLFDEFEAFETAESKFAHAMDNLQPLMLNNSNGGNDWKEHGVCADQVYGRQRKTRLGSEKIFEVVDQIIQENVKKGTIKE